VANLRRMHWTIRHKALTRGFDASISPSFYVEAKQYIDRAGIENVLRGAFRQALDTVGNLPGSGYTVDEAFIILFR
jgi:hypothetical protein